MSLHDLEGRAGWAVPPGRGPAALSALGLAPDPAARGERHPRLGRAEGPGPWMVHVAGWVVVVGAPPPTGEPDRVEFRLDPAADHLEAARFLGGRCVRRVGRRGGARIDEGPRGRKREPDLTEIGVGSLGALAFAWGLDLERAAAAPAVRLAPAPGGLGALAAPRWRLAVGVAAAAFAARVVVGACGARPPPDEPVEEIRAVVGGLGVRGPCAAAEDCAACARCVEADAGHPCADLRRGCDATPSCVAIRACVAACGSPLRETPEGFTIDPTCRDRCRDADPVGVALYEAATRCAWSPSVCPACAWMTALPEL